MDLEIERPCSLILLSVDLENGDDESDSIQSLEREFQQVRQHIKYLVQKRAILLRKIHNHKLFGDSGPDQNYIIDRYKDIASRYLYASELELGEDADVCRFPIFNLLPNEVILQIFGYLDAHTLCRAVMRSCALFCAIALDETLWRPLYCSNWGTYRIHLVYKSDENSSNSESSDLYDSVYNWRTLFTQQSCTENNWWRGHYSVNTMEGHKRAVRCMQFSGDTLITGSADKTVKLWSLSDGKCSETLHDNKWIRCLRYDPASATLVTTGMDSTQAKIWNLRTNTVAHVLEAQRGWITSLQITMPRLVTGSLDGRIRVWDITSPSENQQPDMVVNSGHDSLRSLYLVGDILMSAGLERRLLLWDLRTRPMTPVAAIEGAPQGNYCAMFDLQSHQVASGSNGNVVVGDLRRANAPPVTLTGHTDVVSCLQFSGRRLVTGSMDQTIRVWNMATHSCAHTLHGHESWVWDLQMDPDKVVTVSGDKTIKSWEFNH